MLRAHRVLRIVIMAIPAALILAVPANAEAPTNLLAVECRGQWAAAVTPVVNNITGNAFGLFLAVAVPAGIVAFIGLVFFHWSRHRSVLFSFIGIVVVAMIAVQVWPGIIASLKPAGC